MRHSHARGWWCHGGDGVSGDETTVLSPVMERQRDLEASALAIGKEKFWARVHESEQMGSASTVGAGRKLLQEAVPRMAAAVQHMIDSAAATRGPKVHAVKWCNLLGADVVAYITAKALLDNVAGKQQLREAGNRIADLMLDELRFRRFQEQAPGLFGYATGNFHTSSYRHKARSLKAQMGKATVTQDDGQTVAGIDVSDLDMLPSVKLHVGYKLIGLFVESTGVLEFVNTKLAKSDGRRVRVRSEQYLRATPETLEWVSQRNLKLEDLSPVVSPMIVPPLDWAPGVRGGYRFALRGKYPMVRGISNKHAKTVQRADMPVVYSALNAVQRTAWCVNRQVLDVVQAIKDSARDMAGVPSFEPLPEPPKPLDIDTNDDARRKYRKARHHMLEAEHLRLVRATETNYTLAAAHAVRDEPEVYFPYNVDFRGRLYPIAGYLSPQGSDLAKGLLTFAKGKPLGKDGAAWLAIHGANKLDTTPDGYKISRAPLVERVQWIQAHTQDILDVADDPFTNHWWADADKPLQFLAFCCEWAALYCWCAEGGATADFVSSLPVAADGSCNGIQHFSAMFRDPVGGAAVNLIPSDRPQDVYQRIADTVMDRLETLAASDPLARIWLTSGLVKRDLCKRPTMTFSYGSKPYGFAQQLRSYLREPKRWPQVRDTFVNEDGKSVLGEACGAQAQLIWDALGVTVVAAFSGMEWMQKAASSVCATGQPVTWTVPLTGFPVRQEYYKHKLTRIRTMLLGSLVKPAVYEKTDEILGSKQRNAVAPNVVHSLDAAALMLTVSAAVQEGVESFGMVHDSYATVAGDMGTLATATREQFVRLYTEGDVVDNLAAQWKAQSKRPEKFPEPPAKGTLDIQQVTESYYFFA